MIGRKCGLRAGTMPSSTAATVILQYSCRTHQRTSTYTPRTESPGVSTGMATPSGYSTKMITRFMPVARPQETMVAAADSGPLMCPFTQLVRGSIIQLSWWPSFGLTSESRWARWRGVCERLRAFASVCGCFQAFCWGGAIGRRPGRRVADFQLIVLCIEEGGGPRRAESAGGRGAEGEKQALTARGGRESRAPLVGGAQGRRLIW